MFAGFTAYAPVNTPVLSFESSDLSRSDFLAAASMYSSTASLWSGVVISFISLCSGENTIYVAPKSVSGLVVKTSISFSVLKL